MRARQLATLLLLVFFTGLTVWFLKNPSRIPDVPISALRPHEHEGIDPSESKNVSPVPEQQSVPETTSNSHPIARLIDQASKDAEALLSRQSKTLEEAVNEYRRRYKVHPPPNFDKWFELAKKRKVQLIDEFDSIYQSLLPFWAISPAVLRNRVQEALGDVGKDSHQNFLMSLTIREGKVVDIKEADQWQQEATSGMMNSFIQYLPDMDLAFNIHDEPRIILPHDDLSRLVTKALDEELPRAAVTKNPKGKWSARPKDMGDGKSFKDVRTTRFSRFAHQRVWQHARQSCPPTSPARSLEENPQDNRTTYAITELGFVNNHTAFSDICNSPSLQNTFGFFDRPNSWDVAVDLIPVFSQSKVSSFQDILYPSPWYWAEKVPYTPRKDYRWEDKQNLFWWRGSTTGGYSRDGGWRRHHRQKIVRNLEGSDKTKILQNNGNGGHEAWSTIEVDKKSLASMMDVHFTLIDQCDKGDCDAQKEFFKVEDKVGAQDGWYYKYLLDMDGNGFSGRFYAFLRSKSLPLKMAMFREWHEEWLRPWLHYIPLSLHGEEYFETIRYFDQESSGKVQAKQLAEAGQDWASKILRNEDLEVWFFRLLLEYGRLVDDNRQNLGFGL